MKGKILMANILMVIGIYIAGIHASQGDFPTILLGYGLSSAAIYVLYRYNAEEKNVLFIGILTRVLLLFFLPQLSDDIFRFYWDGKLSWSGINPYCCTPEALVESDTFHHSVYSSMNSPHYYTVYPLLAQILFFLSSVGEIMGFRVIYGLIFIAGDILAYMGLRQCLLLHERRESLATLFFLHPALIIEGVGNLHIEVLVLPCLIWAYLYLLRGQLLSSFTWYWCAVALKVTPLIIAPYIFWILPNHKRRTFILLLSLGMLTLAVPIILGGKLSGVLTSYDLYFRRFEFNASMYYVLRSLGRWATGYNLIAYIGPLLGTIAFITITAYSYGSRHLGAKGSPLVMVSALMIYFLSSTIVHPWYILLMLPFSLLMNHRSALLWTFAAVLSYSFYWQEPGEKYYLIVIEYTLVIGMLIISFMPSIISSGRK